MNSFGDDNFFVIVGLGNPGISYKATRHNVGFMFVDSLLLTLEDGAAQYKKKFNSDFALSQYHGNNIIISKPLCFMNNSGSVVSGIKKFYKTINHKILIVHDDIDLSLGRVKVKCGGGSGGHNGIKSIDQMIGKNYWRLRIGVGEPQKNQDTANYVLAKFTSSEQQTIDSTIHNIISMFSELIDHPELFAQNYHNRFL
ncbi:aminoacyl-tRNA hydrolase [Anaplasmataceae bacterium AB001_6]|nr:aminoacyl-tRNA hydrolase [Anaplasmataceae bacterium AB001_6]